MKRPRKRPRATTRTSPSSSPANTRSNIPRLAFTARPSPHWGGPCHLCSDVPLPGESRDPPIGGSAPKSGPRLSPGSDGERYRLLTPLPVLPVGFAAFGEGLGAFDIVLA